MKRPLTIAVILAVSAAISHAEPRWCSITGKGPNDKITYPPIAKAARVEGIVLSRIIYKPNGKVANMEAISGPLLLSRFLAGQMTDWTLMTNANGEELCETLVIAKFHINQPDGCSSAPEQEPKSMDMSTPSILRLELSASPVPLCDWGPDITYRNPFRRFTHAMKRGFAKVLQEKQ